MYYRRLFIVVGFDLMDMSKLINKNASQLAIGSLKHKNEPMYGEVNESSLKGETRGLGDRFSRSSFTEIEIDDWMEWIERNPPDAWVEVSHYGQRTKKSSLRFLKKYLDGCARDKRIRTHVFVLSFGDWQPKRKNKSWHSHNAVWFETNEKDFFHNRMKCMSERWNRLVNHKDGTTSRQKEGSVKVSPYIEEWRGFAYGAGKHRDMDILIGCHLPNKCRYSSRPKGSRKKRGNGCVYKFRGIPTAIK